MARREVDELAASRHPFETYLLALAVVSGVPLIFGGGNSRTIDASLPPTLVVVWGVMLTVGSSMALVGSYWRGRQITGLVLERAGLVGVGGAAIVYAVAALLAVGSDALFSSCITAGFGAACFAQARRIALRIATAIAVHDAEDDEGRRHG